MMSPTPVGQDIGGTPTGDPDNARPTSGGNTGTDKLNPVDTTPAPNGPSGALAGILEAHNRYRDRHCAPPMTWSKEVAAVAQAYADQLRDDDCSFEHSSNGYGENLAMFGPVGTGSAEAVVQGWYEEVAEYDFGSGGFAMNTGHFTQVVWKGTTQLGCGVAYCGQSAELWVCNYAPAGNVQGGYARNVLPERCK